jgi:hypothetical protein
LLLLASKIHALIIIVILVSWMLVLQWVLGVSVATLLLKSKPPVQAAVIIEQPDLKPGAEVVVVGGTMLLLNPKLLLERAGAGVINEPQNLKPNQMEWEPKYWHHLVLPQHHSWCWVLY